MLAGTRVTIIQNLIFGSIASLHIPGPLNHACEVQSAKCAGACIPVTAKVVKRRVPADRQVAIRTGNVSSQVVFSQKLEA